MKTESSLPHRNRSQIVADIAAIELAVSGKVTEKRKTLRDGSTATYYQLQQWVDGRNVTTHIPRERLEEFSRAVTGGARLDALASELSAVDTKAVLEGTGPKKKRQRSSGASRNRSPGP